MISRCERTYDRQTIQDSEKSPVRIRFKAIKDGCRFIYLDCYRNVHRSYEYLKLYETNDKSLHLNEAAMWKAETVCRKELRELEKLPAQNRRFMDMQGYILIRTYPYWNGFPCLRIYRVVVVNMTVMLYTGYVPPCPR